MYKPMWAEVVAIQARQQDLARAPGRANLPLVMEV